MSHIYDILINREQQFVWIPFELIGGINDAPGRLILIYIYLMQLKNVILPRNEL